MSLINSTRDVLRVGLKEGTRYRALVTKNDDPKQLARIKFKIPNFFEFDVTSSPWAMCQSNGADGAGPTFGTLSVPKVGSYVDVLFTGGSVYHPVYCATSIFKSVQMEKSNINYPNRKIHQLSNGCYFVIDEQDGFMDIFNPGNLRLTVKGSSNLIIGGTCNLTVKGNITVLCEEGDVSATCSIGSVNVEAKSGDATLIANGIATLQSNTGTINLQGPSGSSDLSGVVTGSSICAYTGICHSDYSGEVFATSGGK